MAQIAFCRPRRPLSRWLKIGTAHHDLGATTSIVALPRSESSSRSLASPSSVTKSSSNPFPRLPNV
jgi:hypothetical protein